MSAIWRCLFSKYLGNERTRWTRNRFQSLLPFLVKCCQYSYKQGSQSSRGSRVSTCFSMSLLCLLCSIRSCWSTKQCRLGSSRSGSYRVSSYRTYQDWWERRYAGADLRDQLSQIPPGIQMFDRVRDFRNLDQVSIHCVWLSGQCVVLSTWTRRSRWLQFSMDPVNSLIYSQDIKSPRILWQVQLSQLLAWNQRILYRQSTGIACVRVWRRVWWRDLIPVATE